MTPPYETTFLTPVALNLDVMSVQCMCDVTVQCVSDVSVQCMCDVSVHCMCDVSVQCVCVCVT